MTSKITCKITSKIINTTLNPHQNRQPNNQLNQSSKVATKYPELSIKHKATIAGLLTHRLEIARANQNSQLVSLLEQERQQLEHSQTQPVKTNFWNWLTQPMQISIKQLPSSLGGTIWEGYNPTTGETRHAATEAEIIDWLEYQS